MTPATAVVLPKEIRLRGRRVLPVPIFCFFAVCAFLRRFLKGLATAEFRDTVPSRFPRVGSSMVEQPRKLSGLVLDWDQPEGDDARFLGW